MKRVRAVGAAATAPAVSVATEETPTYVPPEIQAVKLVRDVPPVYPALGKRVRTVGVVEWAVWISEEGDVKAIRMIRGHPLLVPAAIDGVKQWHFRPTYRYRHSVDVVTSAALHFSWQSDGAPDQPGGEQAIIHVSQRYRVAQ